MSDVLSECNPSTINREDCRDLNAELNVVEIQKTITSLNGKTLDPDDPPSELYKKFNAIVLP